MRVALQFLETLNTFELLRFGYDDDSTLLVDVHERFYSCPIEHERIRHRILV